jgi:uncharacterized protein
MEATMKALNFITLLLIIIGGLNWLLVGLVQLDLVAAIFGGAETSLARFIYFLVGIAALWQLVPLTRAWSVGEERAERQR